MFKYQLVVRPCINESMKCVLKVWGIAVMYHYATVSVGDSVDRSVDVTSGDT